jgi:glutamate---cysteine ligase / carboxylate-amine ligase
MIQLNKNIFNHDKLYTIGVEEEYMLCSTKTGELISKANEFMGSLNSNEKDRFTYELILSEIEANTPICSSVEDAVTQVLKLRNRAKHICENIGCEIGISGTHPTSNPQNQIFVDSPGYNWVSNQLQFYARRNNTFALHVHVAVEDAETSIHVTNGLRRWLPPLLALSANSPFFMGELTGMKSTRTMQFSAFPRTQIPNKFEDYEDYKNSVQTYLDLNSINKTRQIWWKIRPHFDYGTIEFRVCDIQRSIYMTEIIIGICQALVHQSVKDFKQGILNEDLSVEFLNDGLWKSTRFGLDSKIYDTGSETIKTQRQMIKTMFNYIKESLDYFGNSHIYNFIQRLDSFQSEADKQIEIYENKGFNGLKSFLISDVDYNKNQ